VAKSPGDKVARPQIRQIARLQSPKVAKSPGRQVAMATKFWTVVPNICGSSVQNLFYVAFLTPGILRWLVDIFRKFEDFFSYVS
jgi:hypothetical protein